MHVYSSDFFASHASSGGSSARCVVPRLVSDFAPASVLDVGCADGAWLAEFARAGVPDIAGVDGPYVDPKSLKFPADRFTPHDLSKPFDLGRRFDLVTSFEVAEHLPPESAQAFVDSLVRHSDLVVFSAAIPGQFGENHINEQWPSYWVKLFGNAGLSCFDCLRAQFWTDTRISWWYRQNMLVFASEARASRIASLRAAPRAHAGSQIDLAHPELMAYFRDSRRDCESVGLTARHLLRLLRGRLRSANPFRR